MQNNLFDLEILTPKMGHQTSEKASNHADLRGSAIFSKKVLTIFNVHGNIRSSDNKSYLEQGVRQFDGIISNGSVYH